MTTIDLLQQIGLNKYEAEAYYTLLTRGSLTGYEVGKHSHVPLSRSYEILERLLEKGLALVQPGEPPRYSAQDPQLVVGRFRSAIETTLDTLTTSLASLAHTDTAGEFWVVRGQENILVQARAMIVNAQTTLDIILPAHYNIAQELAQAYQRGCHVFHAFPEHQESQSILLVRDGGEALVGMLTPADPCQAVISSNGGLVETLHGYVLHRQSSGSVTTEVQAGLSEPQNSGWLDWEARKQRSLRIVHAENRVA